MTIRIKGELEIDQRRGVIYFHSEKGHTALRICQLPIPVPDPSAYGEGLDITHMHFCSWVDELKKDCDAVLYHGPGHQSKTKCKRKGDHEVHYTTYGNLNLTAKWKGKEACTGFFDDPPEVMEGEDDT